MLWNKATHTSIGQTAEEIAERHLIKQKLTILAKNQFSRRGEIDIIALDGDTRVFVEVKYRKSASFGGSIAAVSKEKQKKIKQTAQYYLQQVGLNEYNTCCRFDVVALQGDLNKPEITWLKNAF